MFLASFPVDGARTKVEVLASGTPYLRHWRRPGGQSAAPMDDEGLAGWHTWEDLTAHLHAMEDRARLDAHGAHARRCYDERHAPSVFARHVDDIVRGVARMPPDDPRTMLASASRLLTAIRRGLPDLEPVQTRLAALEALPAQLDAIRDVLDDVTAQATAAARRAADVEATAAERRDAQHVELMRLEGEVAPLAEARARSNA
ncbi:MAG: hypothetical protein R2712_07495 [Vicinamibacterales bacterium]